MKNRTENKESLSFKMFFWTSILFIAITGGGGCNMFTEMSNQTSDAALVDTANIQINQGQWTQAIATLNTLTATAQAMPSNIVLKATAYAGLGGLDIINLANSLNNSSGQTIFQQLLVAYDGRAVVDFNDIVVAESLMLGISGPASGRTVDENTFMIFLELAKLGTLTAAFADPTHTGSLDPSFNNCTAFTVLQASHIVTGIGILLDSLSQANNPIASSALSSVTATCAALAAQLGSPVCTGYDVTAVTAVQREAAETLVGESNANIGLKVTANAGLCEITGPYSGNCPGQANPVLINLCP